LRSPPIVKSPPLTLSIPVPPAALLLPPMYAPAALNDPPLRLAEPKLPIWVMVSFENCISESRL
jgi:hypothetical protein